MIDAGYPWGGAFQIRLLAFLLKDPEQVLNVIEPEFFTDPITVDIAKVIRDIHKEHKGGEGSISKTTLKELVRGALGKKEEHWSLYRKVIRKLYKTKLKDKEVLFDQVREFARETRFRKALVEAERDINAKKYDRVKKRIEDAESFDIFQGDGPWKWDELPLYSEFPVEQVDWLVDDMIPAKHIVVLSGDEGVGKTLFALHMARSLTEGVADFLGRSVKETNVLYLGLDVSQATLQGYIEAMRWQPNRHFRFMTMWTGDGKQPPMFDDHAQVARLYDLVEATQPVIILDTLRDFFDGEENSSTDTKPVVDAMRKLRALGATLILLAHPPKKGSSPIRGTGNIGQKSDIIYVMEKKEQRGQEIIALSIPRKNRAGSTRFRTVFRYIFVPMPGGLRIILADVEEPQSPINRPQDSLISTLVRYVREHEGSNQQKIKQALKMGDRKVKDGLSEALEEGLLKFKPGQAKERLWYLNQPSSEDVA